MTSSPPGAADGESTFAHRPVYRPPARGRVLPLLLALATCMTTLVSGAMMTSEGFLAANGFLADPLGSGIALLERGPAGWLRVVLDVLRLGGPYALALMAFFGAHEMGHFLACRHYGVWATWPHFLPGPPLIGTFGAVIRIRSPIPTRRALFDIGIAGPLAGFVVALPVLAVGILRSDLVPREPLPPGAETIVFGDSLLTRGLVAWLRPAVGDGYELVADPVFVAGWIGMLATVMNLIPAGQFDGGHILYAVKSRYHRAVSLLSAGALWALVLGYGFVAREFSAWTVWAVVVTLFGRRHPPLPSAGPPLDRRRLVLLGVAVAILVLGFLPHPIAIVSGPPVA